MLIEFTKSRACRSQDNALVEGKNGAVIRKHMGYGHIPQQHAEPVHQFHTAHPNPYLNYHWPCGFATVTMDARGRRRRYNPTDYATPNEKLKSLPEAKQYLTGISILVPKHGWLYTNHHPVEPASCISSCEGHLFSGRRPCLPRQNIQHFQIQVFQPLPCTFPRLSAFPL
ncbi:MAG TPA: hypothetical protein VKV18_08530 [Chthonomonas sp.]|uniref:hypothetical protein n=1 Tax=Chthonomonas sp. TaxID=2282153 RepID=UPI002B4B0E96|nr:hypothetical protein [Chthonomonas sp.]HLI48716.1 hypothetical protein [Chthonomonas sp.]